VKPVVVVADGPGTPTVDPVGAARSVGVEDGQLLLGWLVDDREWIAALGSWPARSYQPANALAGALREGRVEYLPARLAGIPALLHGALPPSVAVVPAVARGRGYAFTENVGYADTAVRLADHVVVQVVDDAVDVGAPLIDGNVVAVLDGGRRPTPPVPREPTPVEELLAARAAALVPEGATVQYGLGRVPESVVERIGVPVSVASGLVTDAVVTLDERGLLLDVVASYAWGSDALIGLGRDGRMLCVGLEDLHAGNRLAAQESFVAVNTALQVGLDGSVNIERVSGRLVAGIGGHADYCAAASQSRGGFSLIAVASTHRGHSTIVPSVEVVSTPRIDVHVVVTEHGVADLRGLTDEERRAALLAVADPEHRPALEQAGARV
jgi:acyl-CoA hydrolase